MVNRLSREQSNYLNTLGLVKELRDNFEQHREFIQFPVPQSQQSKFDFQIIKKEELQDSLTQMESTITKLE